MLDIMKNLGMIKLYLSVLETKARVLELAQKIPFSDECNTLLEEVKKLNEIKEKIEKLLWQA